MRKRERRNGLNSVLALAVSCIVFFYLFAWQVSSQNLFVPGPASYEEGDSIFTIEASDGTRLAVYWGPVPKAKRTVFYFHGNAEDLGHVEFILNNYRVQGVNALSFDYRGYGLSEGKPSEANLYADAGEVLDYAIAKLGVAEDSVVFHGRSLGGGVAVELASQRPAAGLILESTFLSLFRIYFPLKWLPADKFRNDRKASQVACPTLIIHGRQDGLVPFDHAEELAALVGAQDVKTLWIDEAGHNDLIAVAGPTYWAAIRGFLSGLE